jgi:hypothetical protein
MCLQQLGLLPDQWQRTCQGYSKERAQVAARLAEFFILRRKHPLISARIAALLHPLGAVALAFMGPSGAAIFAALYGAGNGLLTIARGTVPLAVFGPHGYGERTGLLGAPARAVQAFAPLGFGLLLDIMGKSVILVSAGLCLSAPGALLCLSAARTSQHDGNEMATVKDRVSSCEV